MSYKDVSISQVAPRLKACCSIAFFSLLSPFSDTFETGKPQVPAGIYSLCPAVSQQGKWHWVYKGVPSWDRGFSGYPSVISQLFGGCITEVPLGGEGSTANTFLLFSACRFLVVSWNLLLASTSSCESDAFSAVRLCTYHHILPCSLVKSLRTICWPHGH